MCGALSSSRTATLDCDRLFVKAIRGDARQAPPGLLVLLEVVDGDVQH